LTNLNELILLTVFQIYFEKHLQYVNKFHYENIFH